ncbi:MAG: asparaginase [Phycisphaera sp.]|nr:MAG: asparaginase [Phycisphaera sp.]
MNNIHRRQVLAAGSLAALGAATGKTLASPLREPGDDHRGPVSVASGNGVKAVERAWDLMNQGRDTAEAIVEGVRIVEEDPNDMSVGYGGLPNERGVVQLDASVMHGPTHKAGCVACIEDIKTPASVALEVLRRTDHVMLVGQGAKEFAVALGFKEENLLTDRARRAWLRWKANHGPNDDWLNPEQMDWEFNQEGHGTHTAMATPDAGPIPFTTGTIHCSALNDKGELSGCTTTSGLSYKIPGRVGDSPIIGAGMYADNEIGSAGATGRGEAVIQCCGSFLAVQFMDLGMSPTEACTAVLKRIADRTKQKRLLNEKGEPNFQVTMYAMRKDGAYGSACMRPGGTFAVCNGEGPRRVNSVPLFG